MIHKAKKNKLLQIIKLENLFNDYLCNINNVEIQKAYSYLFSSTNYTLFIILTTSTR